MARSVQPISLAELFRRNPTTWGLRGDPYLWADMASQLKSVPCPGAPAALQALLEGAFAELTGQALSHPGALFIEKYNHGGMSGGEISTDFWRNTAIPLLLARYEATIQDGQVEAAKPADLRTIPDGTTSNEPEILLPDIRRRAGHYEILGETYAKFEFFESGWNPYSRFLDVDKVDLILRRKIQGKRIYREVQVKYGKLYNVAPAWERKLFDVTSWRFFKEGEFQANIDNPDFFVAYVLAADTGYRGDIFIFPVREFVEIIRCGIPSKGQRKVYISRVKEQGNRWVLRRKNSFAIVDETTCLDVSRYRRNFPLLLPEG